ncbi:peptidase M10/serralysin-like protein [Roseiarcus fermentans]|uniref:Peptidase M10/serralysin-like protein n=1 Tax=Roseiarcus fermentans TaxID=1473586 RepID=A0A366FVC1_9HYPH|nr:M10 family metallopeptidase C-terminal domain-containing protein [Roseiarcus fermentans]RBP17695.1 peptidase M10/serralysin-like protein [Roseiarcus fermentans]
MYTSVELQLLRNADPGVKIPGIDTPTGNLLAKATLKPLSAIGAGLPFSYDPSQNVVYVTQAGAVLSGYDLGNAQVIVKASDVTIKNCTFSATSGYFAVRTENNAANMTVTNCTFDSGDIPSGLACWIHSPGSVTVTNNRFIDTPADGVDVTGGGTISGNYFSGSGYTSNGQHPDGIWITNQTAPMTISDNFIDWSTNANSVYGTNDCIRITGEQGPVSNLTITGNFLLNGTTSIQAVNVASQSPLSAISISNNFMGFGKVYSIYPGSTSGITETGNVVFDYTNSAYSTKAWTAYQAAGLPTPTLLASANGSVVNAAASTGAVTLYAGQAATIDGGAHENNCVGGFGVQNIWAGTGANIFTYLSPADSTAAASDLITNFDPAKDVIDLSHIDASLAPGVQQAFAFIGSSAFSGASGQVRVQLDATDNQTLVEATLAGDASPDLEIHIAGLMPLTAANFALTAAQSKAAMANGLAVSDPLSAYWPLAEHQYTNVKGRAYTSYTSISSGSYLVADDLNLTASSGEIELFAPGGAATGSVTISRGNAQETITGSGKTDSLTFHPTETIQAGGGAPSVFALSKGFGAETIAGFVASGAGADTLELSTAAFTYLNAGMSQAQDLAAVLATASSGPSGTTIADSYGDRLTLAGVAAATLVSNPKAVTFA